jgi:ABC-type transporter MlaC component
MGSKTSSRMGGPRGMEQNTQGKKQEIDKEFIENLLKSYSERLAKAHEEIERLKHENAILKERMLILEDKKQP